MKPTLKLLTEAFPECEGPYVLYRAIYKYTECGPTLGLTFGQYGGEHIDDRYGDALRDLGTWQDMDEAGILPLSFAVSSIVEGVEECTDMLRVAIYPDDRPADLEAALFSAVDEVNRQAKDIWNSTHGCDKCKALHREDGMFIDDEDPLWPVFRDCPECGGSGEVK